MNNKPLILITNDDGYQSKGIDALVESVKHLGEIVIFAPDSPRSGMSGAITVSSPLRCKIYKKEDNITAYMCNGTPVDCVKLALNELICRRPSLVLSGINHGSNAAISVLYSGTVGAALEGCVFGIPSIAVSLCDHNPNGNFKHAASIAASVSEKILKEGLPQKVCLNINVPKGEVKGIKINTQTHGQWINEYLRSSDALGNDVYWMKGCFENREKDNTETDEWALSNGYAAIVPIRIDMTAYDVIPHLQTWNLNGKDKI